MRMLTIVAVLLSGLVAPRPADACKCTSPSLRSSIKQSDVVFVGTLVAVVRPDKPGPDVWDRYTFTVESVFKGTAPRVVTVYSGTHSCGWRNTDGKKRGSGKDFLIFARNEHGALQTRQCRRSARLASKQGAADLKRLRGTGSAPTSATIIATSAGSLVFADSAGRNLHAIGPDGAFRWTADVIAACGAPAAGTPRVRSVSASDGLFHVVVGKHARLSIDARTGHVTCRGAD